MLASCVEPIVMDPLEEMPVVVSCVLSRDGGWYEEHPEEERDYTPPAQYLDIYYAQRPSASVRRVISDAAVQVTGPGGPYDFVWNGSRYESAFLPKFDREYKLKIKTADGKELSSSMVFPPDVRLDYYAEQFNSFMEMEKAIYVDPELWTRFSNAWLSSPLHDKLSPVYSTKPVYSNIDGGLGCFGGEWITTINISTGY